MIYGGFNSASSDEEVIKEWWAKYKEANIGLRIPKDVCILDSDKYGAENILGEIPDTVTAITPRVDIGFHYWFKLPYDVTIKRKVEVIPKVDLLPSTGYVIVPNSVHPNGGIYRWKKAPTKHQIAAAPDWLIDIGLKEPDKESGAFGDKVEADKILEGIMEGQRNIQLFRFACWLRARDTDYNVALAAIEKAIVNANPPYKEQSPDYILSRVYSKYHPNKKHKLEKKGYTLRELIELDIQEPKWYIEEMLPEGVCLLFGDPKLGKSLFCYNLAMSVASGELACNKFRTTKSGVLYLDLEVGTELGKQRWNRALAGNPAMENLHIFFEWERMDEGGQEELKKFLDLHPDVGVVVIDVLARYQPTSDLVSGTAYNKDYAIISNISEIAKQYNVAIICVHHKTKDASADFLKQGSGSMGLTAAADVIWNMDRDRHQAIAYLQLAGKNVRTNRIPFISSDEGYKWRTL